MFRKFIGLIGALVLGMLVMFQTDCATVSLEWTDNNLRINRLIVDNQCAYPIAVRARDANNVVLASVVFEPGQHTRNIPGAASRYVDVVEVAPNDFEITINGTNLDLLAPAPPEAINNPSNAFTVQR